jgi:hypothetical protein
MQSEPANNALKLPLFVLGVAIGVVMVVVGALRGRLHVVIAGIIVLGLSRAAIAVIRRGKNPWWIRAPLDDLRRHK